MISVLRRFGSLGLEDVCGGFVKTSPLAMNAPWPMSVPWREFFQSSSQTSRWTFDLRRRQSTRRIVPRLLDGRAACERPLAFLLLTSFPCFKAPPAGNET